MLINYPYASTMTQEYLKLLSQKAILDVTTDKLSTQLVETKMGLTTMEADRFQFEESTNARIRQLEYDIQEKNRLLDHSDKGRKDLGSPQQQRTFSNGGAISKNPNNKKVDQVAEIRSAVTQWMSNSVHKRQASHDTGSTTDNSDDH